MSLLFDALTESRTVTFEAKLPDDISTDEIAILMESIAEVDRAVVLQALRDLEFVQARAYRVWRTEERSVVRKIRYGSDFEVMLGIAGHVVGLAGLVAGLFVAIGKTIQMLSDAGLKNEERLGKRDRRLEHHEERRYSERVVQQDIVYIDLPLDLGVPREPTPQGQKRLEAAREVLTPSESRELIESQLGEFADEKVRSALVQLAEYGVRVRVTDPDR